MRYTRPKQMNQSESDRLLLSNLEALAYQSGELLEDRNMTVHYSDFYELYQGYLPYLRSLPEADEDTKRLVAALPQLIKPLVTKKLFIILLPAVVFFLSPFNLIAFPLYLALLAGIYYAIRNRNLQSLKRIHDISTQLIDKIKVKHSWT
jgi:hypothetical protein